MRLAKRISHAGVCSRRKAEDLIKAGAVTVGGAVQRDVATTVGPADEVAVAGVALPGEPPRARLWVAHKRRGVEVTHAKGGLFSSLRAAGWRGHVVSVGRLDCASEGLLLLTNSPALAAHLESPDSGYLRTYAVRVRGSLIGPRLDALRSGTVVDGVHYAPLFVQLRDSRNGKPRPLSIASVIKPAPANHWLLVTLGEGKNREIRRVLEHLNLRVLRLRREAFGPFRLKGDPGDITEIKIPFHIRKYSFLPPIPPPS